MQSSKIKLVATICIISGSILLSLSYKNKTLETQRIQFTETRVESSISHKEILDQIQNTTGDYQTELNKGLEFIKDHNYRLAIAHFVQANKKDNSQALPFLLSAESYLNLDKPELAKKNIYAASFKKDYGLYGKLVELQYYIYSRENQKAVEILKSLPNQYAEVQFWHAIYALNTQDLKTSTQIFLNLANHKQNNPYYNSALSFGYNLELYKTFKDAPINFIQTLTAKNLLNNNHTVAARLLSYTSLKQNPAFRDSWLTLGYSFVKVREYKKALQTLEKTRKLDPYHPDTHLYLGVTYYNLKSFQNAIRHLKLAINFETKHKLLAKEYLAHSLYETQDIESKNQIIELINENYLTPVLLSNLTQIQLKENQLNQAATTLQLFKTHFQKHPLYFYNLGSLFYNTKNYAKSIENLNLALQLNPNSSESLYLLAQNHKKLENQKTYQNYISQALSLSTKLNNKTIYNQIIKEMSND